MVWTVFLVAVGFRLAALRVPQAQRRSVVMAATQITLAAAVLGLAAGLITPIPPMVALIAAAAAGATAAGAMIVAKGTSQRPAKRPSVARVGGRLAGASTARATAATGALRDLLNQFEQEFGPWAEPQNLPPPSQGPTGSGRPAPPTAPVGNDPYRVLGVSRTDDAEAVRKRYLNLVKRDHPDNYSASDAQAAKRARAEANLKIVTEAYRLIRVDHGWS